MRGFYVALARARPRRAWLRVEARQPRSPRARASRTSAARCSGSRAYSRLVDVVRMLQRAVCISGLCARSRSRGASIAGRWRRIADARGRTARHAASRAVTSPRSRATTRPWSLALKRRACSTSARAAATVERARREQLPRRATLSEHARRDFAQCLDGGDRAQRSRGRQRDVSGDRWRTSRLSRRRARAYASALSRCADRSAIAWQPTRSRHGDTTTHYGARGASGGRCARRGNSSSRGIGPLTHSWLRPLLRTLVRCAASDWLDGPGRARSDARCLWSLVAVDKRCTDHRTSAGPWALDVDSRYGVDAARRSRSRRDQAARQPGALSVDEAVSVRSRVHRLTAPWLRPETSASGSRSSSGRGSCDGSP